MTAICGPQSRLIVNSEVKSDVVNFRNKTKMNLVVLSIFLLLDINSRSVLVIV